MTSVTLSPPPKASLVPAWGCGGAQGDPLLPGLSAHPSLRCRVLPARPFPDPLDLRLCSAGGGTDMPLGINSTLRHPLRPRPRPGPSRRLWPGWRLGSPPSPHLGSGSLLKHPPSPPPSGSRGFGAPAPPRHAAPGRASLGAAPSAVSERGRGFAGTGRVGGGGEKSPGSSPGALHPSSPTGWALGHASVTLMPQKLRLGCAAGKSSVPTGGGHWDAGRWQWGPGKGVVPIPVSAVGLG